MTLSPLRSLGITEWMLLVGLSILWGGSYLFMKLAVLTVPLFTIVLGRVSIAALALLIVLTISGTGIPKGRRIWLAFFGMGIFNNVIPMSLIVFSQNSISVGLASILNSITPLFTILVAHMTTNDERLTFRKLVGISFGFMGVVMLMGPEVLPSLMPAQTRLEGVLFNWERNQCRQHSGRLLPQRSYWVHSLLLSINHGPFRIRGFCPFFQFLH